MISKHHEFGAYVATHVTFGGMIVIE
jgi:hypothetical protein